MNDEAESSYAAASSSSTSLSFPVLTGDDLQRVAETILHLFSPQTASNPERAKLLQSDLHSIQSSTEAWGLISGLASHEDANVRFFGAHTAQVKISRDWDTLPRELHPSLLQLLLQILGHAVDPSNAFSYQSANSVVVRKLFGSLASLLLRLPFHIFPNPLTTVLDIISSSTAAGLPLPPSMPGSGYNTPGLSVGAQEDLKGQAGLKGRLYGLEWLGICVEEVGRAGISEQKRNALRRNLEMDLPAVMETISRSMHPPLATGIGDLSGKLREVEAACRCAESWITYGLGADELSALLPSLYNLLPLPSACSVLEEVLSESVFRFGKGSKILTEPLIAWVIGPAGQSLIGSAEGEPPDEVIAFAKLLCALIEHSTEWLVARLKEADVQTFLGVVLRLTGWAGVGGVDERVSELTLPIYPLIQESLMDSPVFAAPHDTSPDWQIAKSFFSELVGVTRRKVRWPGDGEGAGDLGGLDKEDRESFGTWRRDAGEVVVGAYYILREDMLRNLSETVVQQVQGNAPWQDIEATLHCIRYASEGVPLGEEGNLPIIFGDQVLGALSQRQTQGKGEERLRLTVVSLIQAYEEWFKFHPDHLLPVLSYLVPSLTSTPAISRSAADALKALCDMCRKKLVQHIGAFSELHGKIGNLGPEQQTKVVQAITSVIQALSPSDAIGPVEGILAPIVDRLVAAAAAARTDPSAAQPMLVQTMHALTACFKGLAPSDDEMFDLSDAEPSSVDKDAAVKTVRQDPRMVALRSRTEEAIRAVVRVWNGDGEIADCISSLIDSATRDSSTLISLSPLPLLTLVCTACESSPSALWMSLASSLVRFVHSPSTAALKQDKSPEEQVVLDAEELERWNVIGDAAGRLVVIAGAALGVEGGMRDNPDVVEGWFKFCSAMSSRFPGILLRLPTQLVEDYISLGLMGLAAQERFSLKTATEFFIALLATTRFPFPLETHADTLLRHFGPQILRAILLSAGSEGPRSVIPNLAELLASFVQRVPGQEMSVWLEGVLAEEGFPDRRATPEAKTRLKEVVLRSRTTKKMREALHEFALVARGLDNTTYGNATAV